MEKENEQLTLKIARAKKQLDRLRLESHILYDYLAAVQKNQKEIDPAVYDSINLGPQDESEIVIQKRGSASNKRAKISQSQQDSRASTPLQESFTLPQIQLNTLEQ